jgi:hypothetical protein
MNTNNCYAGFSWRVFKNNRFAGYVVAMSETDAMRKATEKFGRYVWVERIIYSQV